MSFSSPNKYKYTMIFQLVISFCLFHFISCSAGDSSSHFERCTDKCLLVNCTKDGTGFINVVQPFHMKLLLWDCESECKYDCMWKTTDAFVGRKWKVPQFYGKWPFVRILGIQEPASFIFSLMNLYTHIVGFIHFRSNVRNDSPFFWLWQFSSAVVINAWLWSSIFHARDLPFTEFMDYTCAFSIMLVHFYCMVQRMFFGMPRFLNILITSFFLAFFANHAIYLYHGRIDYNYNMKLNIVLGAVMVLVWFVWSFLNRNKLPYAWKCAAFFTLSAFSTTLEIYDFPPILWTFDSHSLWHLSTSIICPLLYSFVVDDCRYLRKQLDFKPKNV